VSEPGAVLGIWDGHEAAVALVHEGRLAFALSEERPSRRKRHSGFPDQALDACLRWAARKGVQVTAVALAGRWGRAPPRLAERMYAATNPHRDPLSTTSSLLRGWENTLPDHPVARRIEAAAGRRAVARHVHRALGRRVPLVPVGHHRAHAHAAMLAPAHADALVITWDAYGEGLAATCRGAEDPETVLAALTHEAGVARLWGALTVALGFREGDEGKVMGLAARGRAATVRDRVRDLFEVVHGGPRLRSPLGRAAVHALLRGQAREDVAAGLQAATEELVGGWIGRLLAANPHREHLALGGGLFANVVLTGALARQRGVRSLHVFGAMGDGGLAAGAARAVHRAPTGREVAPCADLYVGYELDEAQALRAVQRAGLAARRVDRPAVSAGAHVAAGRVVCRYCGRDEFGPRALGHRSILFRADSPALVDRVGRALGRDRSMPFAPALQEEDVGLLATDVAPEALTTMTVAVPASETLRRQSPAAVHVDGSVRPHLVRRDTSPGLWTVLDRQRHAGAPPVVINTSFNRHGEPIVFSPDDAVHTFVRTGLDVLQLGNLEVVRSRGADCRPPLERAR